MSRYPETPVTGRPFMAGHIMPFEEAIMVCATTDNPAAMRIRDKIIEHEQAVQKLDRARGDR